MGFRKDFVWGAATASYQIEGAWNTNVKPWKCPYHNGIMCMEIIRQVREERNTL